MLDIACSLFFQGTSLSSACESGQVTFLDGLKLVSDSLNDDSEEGNNADDMNPFRNLRYMYTIFLFLTTSVLLNSLSYLSVKESMFDSPGLEDI